MFCLLLIRPLSMSSNAFVNGARMSGICAFIDGYFEHEHRTLLIHRPATLSLHTYLCGIVCITIKQPTQWLIPFQYYSWHQHHDICMCTWLITTSIELKTFLKCVYAPKTVLLTHRRFYVISGIDISMFNMYICNELGGGQRSGSHKQLTDIIRWWYNMI